MLHNLCQVFLVLSGLTRDTDYILLDDAVRHETAPHPEEKHPVTVHPATRVKSSP